MCFICKGSFKLVAWSVEPMAVLPPLELRLELLKRGMVGGRRGKKEMGWKCCCLLCRFFGLCHMDDDDELREVDDERV